ncbi:MAG: DUF559 domain-containing protein, partial [Acidimicrobiales bacterium]
VYAEDYCAIFVDGAPHDHAEAAKRDSQVDATLRDLGWSVLRFHHADGWEAILDSRPDIFGEAREARETRETRS